MNIKNDLIFNLSRPSILSLAKHEHSQVFVVGLIKDQVLAKHKTAIPAVLLVLQGSLQFKMNDEIIMLKKDDVYHIPVNTEHEVTGVEERNSFLIIKGE